MQEGSIEFNALFTLLENEKFFSSQTRKLFTEHMCIIN